MGIFSFTKVKSLFQSLFLRMTFYIPAGKLWMKESNDMEFQMNLYDQLLHELLRKEIIKEINFLCNAEAV